MPAAKAKKKRGRTTKKRSSSQRTEFYPAFDITKLKPYKRNPRDSDDAVPAVARSIEEFGFNAPIIVDKNHRVCVGHARLKAAMYLGRATVPILVVKDLSGKKFTGYNIADNQDLRLPVGG